MHAQAITKKLSEISIRGKTAMTGDLPAIKDSDYACRDIIGNNEVEETVF